MAINKKNLKLIRSGVAIRSSAPKEYLFQHKVLCQVFFPYRNPNTDIWETKNGHQHLVIESLSVRAHDGSLFKPGVPYGAKPRLIIIQLNDYAIKQQTATIEIDESMTKFLKKLGYRSNTGDTFRSFKEQMTRVAACNFSFSNIVNESKVVQTDSKIIKGFELWRNKEGQREIWPSTVELSSDYYENLATHAVPLDLRAVRALISYPVSIDIYTWLAERLHRVPQGRPQFIPWPALQNQFPLNYAHIRHFRKHFLDNLRRTMAVYPSGKVDADLAGMVLHNSPPPVLKTMSVVDKLVNI